MKFKVGDTVYYVGKYFSERRDIPFEIINITNICLAENYASITMVAYDKKHITTNPAYIISKAEYFKRELDKTL